MRAARVAVVALAALAALGPGGLTAQAAEPPTGWDGTNPFQCELQYAGFEPTGPNPAADPYCVEFDKRRQNVSQLGVVEFMSKEPARVAAASDKCFYFQSDHWRGSVVQADGTTKTYEWDGHYFFDKARAEGGVWVTNFNFNGHTSDPRTIPGMPPEYARYFGPGTGGFITRNQVQGDPRCAQRAAAEAPRIYRAPPRAVGCFKPSGSVGARRLGPVALGETEAVVRERLGPPVRVHRGFLRYCQEGGGKFLVGVAGDRSGDFGAGSDERVLMLLATNSAYRARRVAYGSRASAVRRSFRRAVRLFRQGRTHVYATARRSGTLIGVRRGRVRFLAVYDRRAVRGRAAVAELLRRSQ